MKVITPKGYRDMTKEEIAEMANIEIPKEVKSDTEKRIEKLEKLFAKISSLLGVDK